MFEGIGLIIFLRMIFKGGKYIWVSVKMWCGSEGFMSVFEVYMNNIVKLEEIRYYVLL